MMTYYPTAVAILTRPMMYYHTPVTINTQKSDDGLSYSCEYKHKNDDRL